MAVNAHLRDSDLRDVAVKVEKGVRLTEDDALRLYATKDLHALAALADHTKESRSGRRVYYNRNRHLDYSNLCHSGCSFCAYSRKMGEQGVFDLSIEEMAVKAGLAASEGATELHIVGGLHPSHPFEWYETMLREVSCAAPDLHLKCFTAVEVHHFSRISGLAIESVLVRLKEAGLDSLPGGGAEIFHPEVRERICPHKADAEQWGAVHRAAHRLGLKSNATMLYGHIETPAHRVDHLRRLREWQDETGGFQAFVPLAYHRGRPDLPERTSYGGVEDLKNLAVARLYLDNFPHIKAYWIALGLPLTQVSLSYGVDDVDGTVMEERIYHATGADTPEALTVERLQDLVREAGKEPVERGPDYREIGRMSA